MRALWLLSTLLPATAAASSVDEVLAEVAPLRALRLATDAPEIPAEAYAKAAQGKRVSGIEAVEGIAAAKGWGVAIYDQPVEAVWKAVNDEAQHPSRLPIAHSAVVRGTPALTGRYLFEYMPLPVVRDRWWIVEVHHNADLYARSGGRVWEEAWDDATDPTMLEGTEWADEIERAVPVAWTKGAWLLVDLGDGRTLAEYFAWSDPGGKLPAGPASRFAGGAIRDTLEAMGQLAAEHAGQTGPGFVRPDQVPL